MNTAAHRAKVNEASVKGEVHHNVLVLNVAMQNLSRVQERNRTHNLGITYKSKMNLIVLIIHAIEYLTKNMAGKSLFDIGVGVDKLEEIKARAVLGHHHLSVISAAVSPQVLNEYIYTY